MLTDELELVSSLTSTLSSFKEDTSGGGGGGARPRNIGGAGRAVGGGGGRDDHHTAHTRDPDVWPPPTPVESR